MLVLCKHDYALSTDDYCIIHKESGLDELEFTISSSIEEYSDINEEDIIFETTESIYYIVKAISADDKTSTCKCQIDLNDWKGAVLGGWTGTHSSWVCNQITAYQLVNDIAYVVGWSVSGDTTKTDTISLTLEGPTPLDAVTAAMELLDFRIRFDNHGKVAKIVYPKDMQLSNSYAARSVNLVSIKYTGKSSDFATRLYAVGKDGLLFSSINGGQPYVENHTWSDKNICALWKDERYTVASQLLYAAQKRIDEMSIPTRTWKCSVIDLFRIDGDVWEDMSLELFTVIRVIDDMKKVSLASQIVEDAVYPYYPSKNSIVISTSLANVQKTVHDLSKSFNNRNSDFWQTIEVKSGSGGGGGSGDIPVTRAMLKGDGSGGATAATADVDYTTPQTLASQLSTKQSVISDLASIRSGAELGRTALQSVPSAYRTAEEQDDIDEGKLGTSGDGSNVTVTFTQATSRSNVLTGEKLSVSLGKIKKWFADLKTVAFTGSYTDLTSKPTIPSQLAQLTGDSTHRTVTDAEKTTWNAKYTKPSGGIPVSDLAPDVMPLTIEATSGTSGYTVPSGSYQKVLTAYNAGREVRLRIDGMKVYYLYSKLSTGVDFSAETELTDGTVSSYSYTLRSNDTLEETNDSDSFENYLPIAGGRMSGDIVFGDDLHKGIDFEDVSAVIKDDGQNVAVMHGTSYAPISVGTPTRNQDAATKAYVDSHIAGGALPLTGGTMTGDITFAFGSGKGIAFEDIDATIKGDGSNVAIMHGNSYANLSAAAPTLNHHVATKAYVDAHSGGGGDGYLPLTGGTITGDLEVQGELSIGDLSGDDGFYLQLDGFNAQDNVQEAVLFGAIGDENVRIGGIATPKNGTDAANKAYVDSHSGGGGNNDFVIEANYDGRFNPPETIFDEIMVALDAGKNVKLKITTDSDAYFFLPCTGIEDNIAIYFAGFDGAKYDPGETAVEVTVTMDDEWTFEYVHEQYDMIINVNAVPADYAPSAYTAAVLKGSKSTLLQKIKAGSYTPVRCLVLLNSFYIDTLIKSRLIAYPYVTFADEDTLPAINMYIADPLNPSTRQLRISSIRGSNNFYADIINT